MKINGFIMADKSQNVPIPIPVDPVESGFTWSYSTPKIHVRFRNQNAGTYQPTGEWTDGWSNSYGPYYPHGEGLMPCDITWENEYQVPRGIVSSLVYILNVTGTITLNIQNLPTGKYVAVFDHYVGGRNNMDESDYTMTYGNPQASKTIKQGAHGAVYGEIIGIEKYDGASSYGIGRMWGIHLRQTCSFEIASGDTSKTFSYGDGTFSLEILAGTKHEGKELWNIPAFGYYMMNSGITPKLYTA